MTTEGKCVHHTRMEGSVNFKLVLQTAVKIVVKGEFKGGTWRATTIRIICTCNRDSSKSWRYECHSAVDYA